MRSWSLIRNIYRVTNYPKLHSFKYRLLSKVIITNIHLCKYRIKSTSLYTFCNIEEESLFHLFYGCKKINSFWNEVFRWLKLNERQLQYEAIILNRVKDPPKLVENLIILIGKKYIYTMKCNETKLSLLQFKANVQSIRDCEKEIVKRSDKIATHNVKWSMINFDL